MNYVSVWIVLAAFVAICVYDALAYAIKGSSYTISNEVIAISKNWPLLPFLVGLVVGIISGHLFMIDCSSCSAIK